MKLTDLNRNFVKNQFDVLLSNESLNQFTAEEFQQFYVFFRLEQRRVKLGFCAKICQRAVAEITTSCTAALPAVSFVLAKKSALLVCNARFSKAVSKGSSGNPSYYFISCESYFFCFIWFYVKIICSFISSYHVIIILL